MVQDVGGSAKKRSKAECDESVSHNYIVNGFNKKTTADIPFFILDFPVIIQ
jgi:hypothetical protein